MKQLNRKSRWRASQKKRGVSPIIATILLVAITVVLAAVLYILISGLTKGPGNTPIGSALTLNRPSEGKAGTTFYYNFSVGSAGGGLAINNLNFQVKTAGGATVPIAGAGPITVVSITTGSILATYSYANAVWTTGNPTLSLNSTMSINIVTTASLSGDALVTIGIGSFSGQVSTAIP